MRFYKLFFPLVTVFLVHCQSPPEQQTDASASGYESQIDSARKIVHAMIEENKIPGMAASVSVKGVMVWSEGFGYADMEAKVPVDPASTMFRIGSVSKTLTASAMGKLMDERKLAPDSLIQAYVPTFPEKRYPISVRQVAGHLAGIRHYRGEEFLSGTYYPTVEEGLSIFSADTLLFEPGTEYSYSSYGWNLVSAAIEGAAGQDFISFMKTAVFDPLGMSNTMPDIATEDIPGRTNFYVRNDDVIETAPYVDNSYKWAGGGFVGTSEDLIKFGNAHLSPGYLSENTLLELQQTQFLINGDTTNYGIGWFSGIDEKGYAYVGHSGGSVGGITQFWIYPDDAVVVAMVTNLSPVSYKNADSRIAWLFIEGAKEQKEAL